MKCSGCQGVPVGTTVDVCVHRHISIPSGRSDQPTPHKPVCPNSVITGRTSQVWMTPGRGRDRVGPLVRHFTDDPPVGGITDLYGRVGCLRFSHFPDPFLRNGIGGLVFLLSRRQRSGVAGCFLDELYAAGEAEFGVDVGEVGLHGAR